MGAYAVVDPTGLVTNLCVWDGSTTFSVSPSTLVLVTGTVAVGYTYAGGVFTYGVLPLVYRSPSASIGIPNARTFALATAYQATDPTRPAHVVISMASTANLSLTTGTTNTAVVMVGPDASVATGGGVQMGHYSNTLTGTLVVGLGLNVNNGSAITLSLPTGYYFAILQTAGTVTMATGFDQSLGY